MREQIIAERDAGVAGGRLEDRLAGADRALLLGVLDQRAGDAVLDRAGRVVRLELGPDAHARLGREARQLDERRVADRLDDVAVATPAGLVLEPLRSHYFTEYSASGARRPNGRDERIGAPQALSRSLDWPATNMLAAGCSGGFDFDWLVIGSGFGGSVSALRLSEKGYRVGVLECGRRFADHEFPESTSDCKRYFWRPRWDGRASSG